MSLDWILFALLLAIASVPLIRRSRSPIAWAILLPLWTCAVVGAIQWQNRINDKQTSRAELEEHTPTETRSDGYIGSSSCKACHPDAYDSWHKTYHRTMTQYASRESVRGNFEDVHLYIENERYSLSRVGDEFWVDMPNPDFTYGRSLQREAYESGRSSTPPPTGPAPRARKRIGLLTGSHLMQSYWVPSVVGNEQFTFPFAYLFEIDRWVPRNDIFLMPPNRPPLLQVWNGNCINCHTTGGQPKKDSAEQRFDTQLAEVGISCESCHGPAEEHRRTHSNPMHRYQQHASAKPDPTIINPARQTPRAASENCSQCHSIRYNDQKDWNENGFHYRPGGDVNKDRPLPSLAKLSLHNQLPPELREDPVLWTNSFWSDGMVRVSGREFNGLANSACFQRGELSCLSCHSMHNSDPEDQLIASMDGNQACLQCHGEFAKEKDLQAHTRHAPDSSGSQCYNCHMPHTRYGLLKAIRSHQIDSPSTRATLLTGRPNACNLCHLDKSLKWTDEQLTDWTEAPPESFTEEESDISAIVLWLLKGDAGQRALASWHLGWEPAVTTSNPNWIAPYLAEGLIDPYSAVRYLAARSLKQLPGYEHVEFDYLANADKRAEVKEQVLDIWRNTERPTNNPSVLIESNGNINRTTIQRLLQLRDHKPMHLWE